MGDEVAVDQGLIVLESDKASMEIPATVAGTIVEVLVAVGQELAEGAPVAVIEVAGEGDTPPVENSAQRPAPEDLTAATPEPPTETSAAATARAGWPPLARRAELGGDLLRTRG